MKKIPTIFVRDFSQKGAPITQEWHPDALWVRDGEGVPTIKWDGTCCLVRGGKLYKRREIKPGQVTPVNFEPTETDATTGKIMGWVPVDVGPEDKWHMEAVAERMPADGTYELIGPKMQGFKDSANLTGLGIDLTKHHLFAHGGMPIANPMERTFDGLRSFLGAQRIEGIVWHHPDGRMAKIKRRDFGLPW